MPYKPYKPYRSSKRSTLERLIGLIPAGAGCFVVLVWIIGIIMSISVPIVVIWAIIKLVIHFTS